MKQILIIEDEDAIAELERDYLELSGFSVEWIRDGQEGLQRALQEPFDLFLVDVMLPGTDGFTIVKELREKKNTPILIVSARKEDIDKIRGLGLGADDYITKPFSPGELVARVKAHLDRYERIAGSAQPTEKVYHIRGLQVDMTAKTVMLDGEEIMLTAKEYDLLTFFVTHPNRVYSKEELFRELWDSEEIGENQAVAIYVKKLRRKIEKDPSNPKYIETVWGMGYRLKV